MPASLLHISASSIQYLMVVIISALLALTVMPGHAQEAGETSDDALTGEPGGNQVGDEGAAETSEQAPPAAPVERSEAPNPRVFFDWLEKAQPPGETVWLASDEGEFFTLHARERRGQPKGAVILLHDEGQFAGWPDYLQALHRQLPEAGWHSLFISLPDPHPEPVPERSPPVMSKPAGADEPGETDNDASDEQETPDEQAGSEPEEANEPEVMDKDDAPAGEEPEVAEETQPAETPTAETPPPVESEPEPEAPSIVAQQRIQAAINYLNDQGVFNIAILGDGVGAVRAGVYVESMPKSSEPGTFSAIQAMVILNGVNNESCTDHQLEKMVGEMDMPVLDLQTGYNRLHQRDAQMRLNAVPQLKRGKYIQIQVPPAPGKVRNTAERIAKRIRGWLDNNVAGNEIRAVRQ